LRIGRFIIRSTGMPPVRMKRQTTPAPTAMKTLLSTFVQLIEASGERARASGRRLTTRTERHS
jgi:hypothetical protein